VERVSSGPNPSQPASPSGGREGRRRAPRGAGLAPARARTPVPRRRPRRRTCVRSPTRFSKPCRPTVAGATGRDRNRGRRCGPRAARAGAPRGLLRPPWRSRRGAAARGEGRGRRPRRGPRRARRPGPVRGRDLADGVVIRRRRARRSGEPCASSPPTTCAGRPRRGGTRGGCRGGARRLGRARRALEDFSWGSCPSSPIGGDARRRAGARARPRQRSLPRSRPCATNPAAGSGARAARAGSTGR